MNAIRIKVIRIIGIIFLLSFACQFVYSFPNVYKISQPIVEKRINADVIIATAYKNNKYSIIDALQFLTNFNEFNRHGQNFHVVIPNSLNVLQEKLDHSIYPWSESVTKIFFDKNRFGFSHIPSLGGSKVINIPKVIYSATDDGIYAVLNSEAMKSTLSRLKEAIEDVLDLNIVVFIDPKQGSPEHLRPSQLPRLVSYWKDLCNTNRDTITDTKTGGKFATIRLILLSVEADANNRYVEDLISENKLKGINVDSISKLSMPVGNSDDSILNRFELEKLLHTLDLETIANQSLVAVDTINEAIKNQKESVPQRVIFLLSLPDDEKYNGICVGNWLKEQSYHSTVQSYAVLDNYKKELRRDGYQMIEGQSTELDVLIDTILEYVNHDPEKRVGYTDIMLFSNLHLPIALENIKALITNGEKVVYLKNSSRPGCSAIYESIIGSLKISRKKEYIKLRENNCIRHEYLEKNTNKPKEIKAYFLHELIKTASQFRKFIKPTCAWFDNKLFNRLDNTCVSNPRDCSVCYDPIERYCLYDCHFKRYACRGITCESCFAELKRLAKRNKVKDQCAKCREEFKEIESCFYDQHVPRHQVRNQIVNFNKYPGAIIQHYNLEKEELLTMEAEFLRYSFKLSWRAEKVNGPQVVYNLELPDSYHGRKLLILLMLANIRSLLLISDNTNILKFNPDLIVRGESVEVLAAGGDQMPKQFIRYGEEDLGELEYVLGWMGVNLTEISEQEFQNIINYLNEDTIDTFISIYGRLCMFLLY